MLLNKQEAANRFSRTIFGFVDVVVGLVRDIPSRTADSNLDVIQDEEFHALIIGIPFFHDLPQSNPEEKAERKAVKKKAEAVARELASSAPGYEYVKEGFSPSILAKRP